MGMWIRGAETKAPSVADGGIAEHVRHLVGWPLGDELRISCFIEGKTKEE